MIKTDPKTGRFIKQFSDKELICEQCGKKFIREHHRLNRQKNNFCSLKCAYEYRKGKNSSLWTGGEIETKCDFCNKIIKIKQYQLKQKNHFCSYKCYGKFKQIKLKGTPSFFKGHIHKEESKIKIGNKLRGKKHTEETKQKISIGHIGKNKGRKCHFFGKPSEHGKWINYNNKWFRSSWESKFAKFLDSIGIKWLYEPESFNLDEMTYTPDFYLPEQGIYIEIKGYWRPLFLEKYKLFKNKYIDKVLILYEKKDLQKLGVL